MISWYTSIAFWIIDFEMFPLFDTAHDYLAAVDVRKAWGPNFARESPISACFSWALTIVCIYAGSFISNILLGQNVMEALTDKRLLMLATIVWFAVSYSPYDVVYRFGENFPVKMITNILKEIYRAKKVSTAVFQMTHFYHSWIFTQILIGIIRGNGAGVVKQIAQIIQKTISPKSAISAETTLSTKSCFLASIIYWIKFNTNYIPYAYEVVHLAIVLFFVVGKVLMLLFQTDYRNKLVDQSKDKSDKTMKTEKAQKTEKKTN